MKEILIPVLILLLLAGNASAADYIIKIGTELKTNVGWSTQQTYFLNASETVTTPGGLSVSLASNYYDTNTKQVWFKVTPFQNSNPDILLKENDKTCLKGNSGDNSDKCITDPNNATEGTIRLTLLSIAEKSTATSSSPTCNNASDDIITTYVSTSSGPKYIKNNDIPTYDITSYSSTTGWTSSVADKDVNLYIKTNCVNYDTEVSLDSKGEYSGPYYESDNSIMRYTLESNEKYLFTVKVKQKVGPWNSDNILTYGIILKGLAGDSSCNLLIPAPYEVTLGNSKDLTLPDGEFTSLSGFTPSKLSTANGKTNWKVSFSQPGTYTTVYTPTSCSPTGISFTVAQNTPAPTPTTTVKVTGSQGIFTDDTSKSIIIVIAFVLVAAAIILFLKNRKSGSRGKFGRGRDEESGAT